MTGVTGHAPSLDSIPQSEILDAIRERRDEWVDFVRTLALHESPSTDRASQAHILDLMGWKLEEFGFGVRRIAGSESGGMLFARSRAGGPAQLMLGHTDTVWPAGTLNRMPVELADGRLRGPGVFDMKAGLAQMVFALQAIRDLGLSPEVEPVVFLNSDEEIGSGESERHIRRLARRVCRAFVLEPALDPAGKLKTARMGVGRFVIRVEGKESHAGLAPREGISAIQELSHVIQTLHQLTDFERGVVVNVGQIRGGTRPNVVAAEAEAVIDVRVNTIEEGEWVRERIHAIEPVAPGVNLHVEGGWTVHPSSGPPRTGCSGVPPAGSARRWVSSWRRGEPVEDPTGTPPISIRRRWMGSAQWGTGHMHCMSTLRWIAPWNGVRSWLAFSSFHMNQNAQLPDPDLPLGGDGFFS